ncbi:hypothetical protein [Novosphingobium sp. MMS21-SN21R]|uniref:hypothetical protein n=1 Tax=Novosphingobium sp. MMS21-SN21R TaxID=2969298 RepID=UPI0028869134|nr:hypothetical protein [Novosphingobium sp. MMS21-SN21R]MDT0507232.1 hypothetical protein [Novosphingobium sp. MMS21-SN21R]
MIDEHMLAYDKISCAIRDAVGNLSKEILDRPGSIFYSGKEAFSAKSDVYVLGLNPGGQPCTDSTRSVVAYNENFKNLSEPWSEYLDESWEGAVPGTWGLQPQILHMLDGLGLDPRYVPASNVVFVRSRSEKDLLREKAELLASCWPVHQAVIDSLGINTVLCFGKTAGTWVRQKLAAKRQIDKFTEQNKRGWTSTVHECPLGRRVVTLTHPSRANWRNPLADPTPLVRRAIAAGYDACTPALHAHAKPARGAPN